ncbi:MAG: heat-inducible transcription repressor HrcA [Deltaproteobacteria bacterium]|nr:heat-inducible transcription repressor HrcA [Deltaproteobacteria bacterium]
MKKREKTELKSLNEASTLSKTSRSNAILRAVVREFIRTASAVSSRVIAKEYALGLKSASIRSVMAKLKADGYLRRTHTSSGVAPTNKGFRLYVDSLLELEEIEEGDKRFFSAVKNLEDNNLSFNERTKSTVRALSAVTSCAGIVLLPGPKKALVKNIRFLPVDKDRLMVVVLSVDGLVHSKVIQIKHNLDARGLEKASNYLSTLGAGLSLSELKTRLIQEREKERNLYDLLLKETLRVSDLVFTEVLATNEELLLEGTAQVLDQPEFTADAEQMRKVFRAFEEKSLLVKILNQSLDEQGTQIFIGSETEVEDLEQGTHEYCENRPKPENYLPVKNKTALHGLDGLSIIIAPYGNNNATFGTLGVIGPLRMNYPRIVPIVNYAASTLCNAL